MSNIACPPTPVLATIPLPEENAPEPTIILSQTEFTKVLTDFAKKITTPGKKLNPINIEDDETIEPSEPPSEWQVFANPEPTPTPKKYRPNRDDWYDFKAGLCPNPATIEWQQWKLKQDSERAACIINNRNDHTKKIVDEQTKNILEIVTPTIDEPLPPPDMTNFNKIESDYATPSNYWSQAKLQVPTDTYHRIVDKYQNYLIGLQICPVTACKFNWTFENPQFDLSLHANNHEVPPHGTQCQDCAISAAICRTLVNFIVESCMAKIPTTHQQHYYEIINSMEAHQLDLLVTAAKQQNDQEEKPKNFAHKKRTHTLDSIPTYHCRKCSQRHDTFPCPVYKKPASTSKNTA